MSEFEYKRAPKTVSDEELERRWAKAFSKKEEQVSAEDEEE